MVAAQLPAALKSADVSRFALRAAQLEKFKPIATYWLEYYILQVILAKSLHTTGDGQDYAVRLMDKLEQTKATYANEPAITDDIVAKAYMEQFAAETFARGETAQNTDQVTRQTADTFQAAATFYDSLSIFGELDPESKAKSKFAKFHALRIVRAIKEGQDPNETNPKVEPPEPISKDDDLEAELNQLERPQVSTAEPFTSSLSSPPSQVLPSSSFPAQIDAPYTSAHTEVSPLETTAAQRTGSVGGGYFPNVPGVSSKQPIDLASPQVDQDAHIPSQARIPDMLSPSIDQDSHVPFASTAGHVDVSPAGDASSFYKAAPIAAPIAASEPVVPTAAHTATTGIYNTDDDAVMAAQKHAKWAISALNFEDVPTAVKELRIALQSLGGL